MDNQVRVTGTDGAARLLGVSPPTVRKLVDIGELPCERTETGRRIFRVADVELVATRRLARKIAADGFAR